MNNTQKKTSDLIRSVKDKLLERGCTPGTIDHYKCCWNKLTTYMKEHGIVNYNPQAGLSFLEDVCGIKMSENPTIQQRFNARAIKLLNDFIETGTIFPISSKISASKSLKVFGDLLTDFKQYQTKKFQISVTTLNNYDRYIGRFLKFLEDHISDISCLTPVQILNYCKNLAGYKEGIAHNASCSIRVFLRYLNTAGLVKADYSHKVPSFAYSRKSRLPSALSDDEAAKMLNSIDRSNGMGKRDYAIILLAWRLGFRSGDIRTLEFSHIHWERNTIERAMQKGGKTIVLPLLDEVGMAIIDYIKYARPETESPVIFQTCSIPIKPISAPGMSGIVKRVARIASVNTVLRRPIGPHTLRSTLASAMLAEDVPLPVISGILGHSNTRTTQEYYLRIGKKQLQRCALDVPRFSWDPEEEVF